MAVSICSLVIPESYLSWPLDDLDSDAGPVKRRWGKPPGRSRRMIGFSSSTLRPLPSRAAPGRYRKCASVWLDVGSSSYEPNPDRRAAHGGAHPGPGVV